MLKQLFKKKTRNSPVKAVDSFFKEIRFEAKAELPSTFTYILEHRLLKVEKPSLFLAELLSRLKKPMRVQQVIKAFTIIHAYIVSRSYCKEEIEVLQEANLKLEVEEEEGWFEDFASAYLAYLIKMPSLADIYQMAFTHNYSAPLADHLLHIFRSIHQLRLLFPFVTKAVNVIGRYQTEKHSGFREFYRILSSELVNLYSYLYYLISKVMNNYKLCSRVDLVCFLQVIPEMETVCDRTEDLLVNKYMKGKKIRQKVEFTEEVVAEMSFHLEGG